MTFAVAQWLLSTLTYLCLAATVILQWFLWVVYTGNVIHPYGMVVGAAISVAQMAPIFRSPREPESCPLPPRGGNRE